MYVTSQKPERCWPRRLPGAPRAEALSVFALTFLFLLPSYDLRPTYSFWRTFGMVRTRSQLSVRQLRLGPEKSSPPARQNMQTSCPSLPDPDVQPTPSPLCPRLPPTKCWELARARVGQRLCRADRPTYRRDECRALRSQRFAQAPVLLEKENALRKHSQPSKPEKDLHHLAEPAFRLSACHVSSLRTLAWFTDLQLSVPRR